MPKGIKINPGTRLPLNDQLTRTHYKWFERQFVAVTGDAIWDVRKALDEIDTVGRQAGFVLHCLVAEWKDSRRDAKV
jgi:hypothetical protein